jgi:hypothetical protein
LGIDECGRCQFSRLNQWTNGMNLVTNDRILSHSPARLETYYRWVNTVKSSWSGGILPMSDLPVLKCIKYLQITQQPTVSNVHWSSDCTNWMKRTKTQQRHRQLSLPR